jgi:hypothetical protein
MKILASRYLITLCFLVSRCKLGLGDLLNDRWVSEDGFAFRPERELNLLPGVYARDNMVHIKKMLLSLRTSVREIPNAIRTTLCLDSGRYDRFGTPILRSKRYSRIYSTPTSGIKEYDRFYLTDSNAEPLADFDGTLVYLFQFGDVSDDKGRITFPAFLASLERSRAVKFLSMCMAIALGSTCERSLDEFIEASNLNKARKKIHEKHIQAMLEYLGGEEEPYNTNGKVYIDRYTNSKFMLLHIFLVGYLNKGEVGRFHSEVYRLLDEGLRDVYYISSDKDNYTRCERMLLESSGGWLIEDMRDKCRSCSPGGSLPRPTLHCSREESNLAAVTCDCAGCSLENEMIGNLPDLMIRHMKYENNSSSADTKALYVAIENFAFFFDKRFYVDTLEDFALCISDSILLVNEEDMSDEIRKIRNRTGEIVELHCGDMVNEAYAACRRHFTTGEREELDRMDVKCLEELAKRESCGNLINYIVENVDGDIIRRVSKEGLDGMLRAIVFGAANLQALKNFVWNVLNPLTFKNELLAPLAGSCCCPRDRELLKFVFMEVDTDMLIREELMRRSSFSNLFGDICIEIAGQENADLSTVRRAYDWIFLACCESRSHFSLRLLDHTYRRFTDSNSNALYRYILRGVASRSFTDERSGFALLMLEFCKKESLYIPYDMYCGLLEFCHGLSEEQKHFQLVSGLKEAGLLVEGDALNKDKIALLVEKNPLNRTIIDPKCRDGMPKSFSNNAFKGTYEWLSEDFKFVPHDEVCRPPSFTAPTKQSRYCCIQ